MTKAPERIWVQDADPRECDYTGGGWWDDECGNTQYPHMVEYIRADLHAEMMRAADEMADAARLAVQMYGYQYMKDSDVHPMTEPAIKTLDAALTAYQQAKEKLNATV